MKTKTNTLKHSSQEEFISVLMKGADRVRRTLYALIAYYSFPGSREVNDRLKALTNSMIVLSEIDGKEVNAGSIEAIYNVLKHSGVVGNTSTAAGIGRQVSLSLSLDELEERLDSQQKLIVENMNKLISEKRRRNYPHSQEGKPSSANSILNRIVKESLEADILSLEEIKSDRIKYPITQSFKDRVLVTLERLRGPIEFCLKVAEVLLFIGEGYNIPKMYQNMLDINEALEKAISTLRDDDSESLHIYHFIKFVKTYHRSAFSKKDVHDKEDILRWCEEIDARYNPLDNTFKGHVGARVYEYVKLAKFYSVRRGMFKEIITSKIGSRTVADRVDGINNIHECLLKMGKVARPVKYIEPHERFVPETYEAAIKEILERESKKMTVPESYLLQNSLAEFASNLKGMKGGMDRHLFLHYLDNIDGIVKLYERLYLANKEESMNGQVFLEE